MRQSRWLFLRLGSEDSTGDTEPEPTGSSAWTDDELRAGVDAYLSLLSDELAGREVSKAALNRSLRAGPLAGRSKASVLTESISRCTKRLGFRRTIRS